MARLVFGIVVLLGSLTPAMANLTPRKEPRRPARRLPLRSPEFSSKTARAVAGREATEEFSLTEQSEVLLNGKPCKYDDVPDNARVIYMEVTPDRKHILRVHFKSKK